MVFSSIPAYLDPANWQQQPIHHANPQQQLSAPPPPPPPVQPLGGSIRPGSMAERARLANIPMPEPSLKCPRCESSNTKFCYFNNYSLTQPRHFCKTCRRYWTRGGALRNVPVGGGCRRNKRTKSTNNSKSPASSSDRQTASSSTSQNTTSSNSTIGASPHHHIPSLLGLTPPQIPPLRFLSPMSQLSDHYGGGDIGLSYGGGLSTPSDVGTSEMNFHVGPSLLGGGHGGVASLLSGGGGAEQWRLQQHFPFFGGMDSPSNQPGLYPVQTGMEGSGFGGETSLVRAPKISASMLSQLSSIKMEDNNQNHNNNHQELNLSRQLMVMNQGNHHEQQQWNNNNTTSSAAAWTDLTSFSSSSTTAP